MKKTIVIGLLSIFAAYANAGQYRFFCNVNVDCTDLFTDLVSDNFTNKYPAKNWEIYVLADTVQYTTDVVTGMAFAGVRPYRADGLSVVPGLRFNSHRYETATNNPYEKNKIEREVIRGAIEYMMSECERRPNCNINK
ncbi:hypothetical protein [Vogesella indigofera]|uniref:hypothetical protein n=1 Tax=Vogesella indigofera TaxID=45465 RepID=UPI00234C8CD9|nr:hypothetical protein [Vogesella indigofera]MDC7704031.1 hypothetical protein [Vogesella indigofera]